MTGAALHDLNQELHRPEHIVSTPLPQQRLKETLRMWRIMSHKRAGRSLFTRSSGFAVSLSWCTKEINQALSLLKLIVKIEVSEFVIGDLYGDLYGVLNSMEGLLYANREKEKQSIYGLATVAAQLTSRNNSYLDD